MQKSKVETYLGFCLRAGKLTMGVNAVETVKKGVFLLVMEEDTAVNSRKAIEKLRNKFNCPLVAVTGLESFVGKPNCKLAAVRDKSLAEAIYGEVGKGQITEKIGGLV